MRIVSFFGEQFAPQLLGRFLVGFLLSVVLEPKIVAIVGAVFFFYILCLGFPALVRFGFVEEDAVETDVEVGAARLTFVAS
jgi:hypothetical protein